ncbi:MAG: hypothetical protein J5698_00785 [Bacteroidaceae bacterium]|nr:hypothetical protein [Bacteroidaceae bacterium]
MKSSYRILLLSAIWWITGYGTSFAFDKTFTFDLEDFQLISRNGKTKIETTGKSYSFELNAPGYPDIPFFRYSISTNNPCDITTLKYEIVEKKVIASNVSIQHCVTFLPTGETTASSLITEEKDYSVYPDSLIRLYNGPMYRDKQIVLFISPFIYDKTAETLSFVSQIKVSFEELPSSETSRQEEIGGNRLDKFAYLIITHDSLVNAFKELRDWKTAKGVKTQIVSLDSIRSFCSSTVTTAYEIKQYIKNCHDNRETQMVLLGGCPEIVPTKMCYVNYCNIIDFTPCDMYYSCLDGDLTWDANGNNVIGEITGDGVNLTPTVSVTRLPIRTSSQATAYIKKLKEYEMNPDTTGDSLRLLMSGNILYWYHTPEGISDAHFFSELLYNYAFHEQYPDLSPHSFFDTGNDLDRHGLDSIVNVTNLTDILNDYHPHYFNMDTHGNDTAWVLFNDDYYSSSKVTNLENGGAPMVITTSACHTANFRDNYPCLGEAFIQHPTGGALTYWGSSKYGFTRGEESQSMGPSMKMCTSFWEKLPSHPNYGEAVMEAKREHLSSAYNSDYAYNWLLKSMNALGDCEVPIYTQRPSELSDITVYVSRECILVYAEDTINIAIISKGNNGETLNCVEKDVGYELYFNNNPPITSSICLTKKNHIPLYTETGRFVWNNGKYSLLLQNLTYKSNVVRYESDEFDNIYVGRNVDNTIENGDVIIEEGGAVELYAYHRTTIQPGFRCKTGGKLKIKNETW